MMSDWFHGEREEAILELPSTGSTDNVEGAIQV